MDVQADRIIAIMDRAKHNQPLYPYGVTKVFVESQVLGGKFTSNSETTESEYFTINQLPKLATEKNTFKQIELCFKAKNNINWEVYFDWQDCKQYLLSKVVKEFWMKLYNKSEMNDL